MDQQAILQYFHTTIESDPDKSVTVAAIETLIEFISKDTAGTMFGLRENLKAAIETLNHTDSSSTSVSSGCDLFWRHITLASLENQDFEECRPILITRGKRILERFASSRKKVSRFAGAFIQDGDTILTHSKSRVILQVLKDAADAKKRFTVYVTESCPDKSGLETKRELEKLGIPCTSILDCAVGHIMEQVDYLLVGAEGVVESGGIINKIGTFGQAICAKEMNKPVYVAAESFKFVRLFPLNQQDLPNHFKYKASTLSSGVDLLHEYPLVDYTPPLYITLLFTDLGVLTPSAVSDQLIQLYL